MHNRAQQEIGEISTMGMGGSNRQFKEGLGEWVRIDDIDICQTRQDKDGRNGTKGWSTSVIST